MLQLSDLPSWPPGSLGRWAVFNDETCRLIILGQVTRSFSCSLLFVQLVLRVSPVVSFVFCDFLVSYEYVRTSFVMGDDHPRAASDCVITQYRLTEQRTTRRFQHSSVIPMPLGFRGLLAFRPHPGPSNTQSPLQQGA